MTTAKKKKPPTSLQLLRQLKKSRLARDRANAQQWILNDMASKAKGRTEVVVDGDEVYRVSVDYGAHASVDADLIGTRGDIAEILR